MNLQLFAVQGYRAQVSLGGLPLSFTDEETTPNAATPFYPAGIAHTITSPNIKVLHPEDDMIVEVSTDGGTTWEDAPPHKMDRLFARVVFSEPFDGAVRVTGTYIPVTRILGAYEASMSPSADNQDTPEFGEAFTKRVSGIKDASASLSKYATMSNIDLTSHYFTDKIALLDYAPDSRRGAFARMWGLVSSDEFSSSADGVSEESFELDGVHDADSRSFSLHDHFV